VRLGRRANDPFSSVGATVHSLAEYGVQGVGSSAPFQALSGLGHVRSNCLQLRSVWMRRDRQD